MKLSQKKRDELYNAIREPIIQLRIELRIDRKFPADIDYAVAQLESKIWREVLAALEKPSQPVEARP